MQELFVKKYWDEEDVLFYIRFQDCKAVKQIEKTPKGRVLLTPENPHQGESILYDQSLDELELNETDFITEVEFDKVWNGQ
ncbi:hypothetical protein FXV77_21755 [Sphingobacterium phlebotomi]|uniref:Uncharacterized protein n=1 Tax=Sphingobacterium phlebotomi TaxID=2605433 RepID=A0A5D4GS74_9SPHI|nr:hypothetical protein [Sphingobacterium phlebotomi]TYR30793.1 hypothetical protein FXV77_21755 [Sphingobacterium phlebotomi]